MPTVFLNSITFDILVVIGAYAIHMIVPIKPEIMYMKAMTYLLKVEKNILSKDCYVLWVEPPPAFREKWNQKIELAYLYLYAV